MTTRGSEAAAAEGPPPSDAPLLTLLEYALTYDGYERLAGTVQRLGALVKPVLATLDRTKSVPEWAGGDLLRGALFFVQRQTHHWGDVPAHQEWQMRRLVEALTARDAGPGASA